MSNDNGYARAEKEFLEPPDDVDIDCELCGMDDACIEHNGSCICIDCYQEACNEQGDQDEDE